MVSGWMFAEAHSTDAGAMSSGSIGLVLRRASKARFLPEGVK
jgi:hypothetical protein